jgi:hypothetical protein
MSKRRSPQFPQFDGIQPLTVVRSDPHSLHTSSSLAHKLKFAKSQRRSIPAQINLVPRWNLFA